MLVAMLLRLKADIGEARFATVVLATRGQLGELIPSEYRQFQTRRMASSWEVIASTWQRKGRKETGAGSELLKVK